MDEAVPRRAAAKLIYNALGTALAVDEVYLDPESEEGYSFRVRILDGTDGGEACTLYNMYFEQAAKNVT